jgi:hypothetical protein
MIGKSYMKKAATIVVAFAGSVAGIKAQTFPGPNGCGSLPGYTALKVALDSATSTETSGQQSDVGDDRRSGRHRLRSGLLRRKQGSPVAWE